MSREQLAASPFVGREQELEALADCYERAAAGRTTLVAISGEAGIGKSRLVGELNGRIGGRSHAFAVGHCLEHLKTPFLPFEETFRGLGLNADETLFEGASAPMSRGRVQSEKRLRRLQGMTHALLRAATKKPHVIVLEDVHWADAASLGLLEHLAISRTEGRLLVILTLRSEAAERGGAIVRVLSRLRSASLVTVRLGPLEPHEMTSLLQSASPEKLPRATIERIKGLAEGNPLFAEELLRAAIDDDGTLLHPAYASIRATVLDRLYQLTEADQRVVTCAAVVGRFFDPRVVATLAKRPFDETLSALRRARNLQLVRETETPGTLAFRHVIFSEIVYRELLDVEARDLHARVAEYLEQQPDVDRRRVEVAYHWSASGERKKALRWNVLAGDAAMRLTAFEDAAHCYDEAIEHTKPGTIAHAELAEKRAYAWYAAGVAENTAALFSDALAAYEKLGRRQKVVEMLLFMSRQAWNDAETPDGYRHAMQAAALIGDEDPALREYALTMAASYATHLGEVAEAERILEGYPSENSPEIAARILDTKAIILVRNGEPGEGLALCQKAQEFAKQSGDPDVLVRVYSNSADIYATCGQRGEAAELWRSAFMAAQAGGYIGRMAYAALGYAGALIDCGELRQARQLYDIAVETGVTNASVAIQAAAVSSMLRCLVGPIAPAFVDDETALQMALRSKESLRIGQLAAALVFAHVSENRRDQAQKILRRSVAALESPVFAEGLLLLAVAHGDGETRDQARRLLGWFVGRSGFSIAQQCQGIALGLDLSEAQRVERLRKCAAHFEELSCRMLQVATLVLVGDAVEAGRLLDSIGATAYARRLSAASVKEASRPTSTLTPREMDVARLLAAQESNRIIAARLGISERTVEHHVQSILSRLDVPSRWLVTPDLIERYR